MATKKKSVAKKTAKKKPTKKKPVKKKVVKKKPAKKKIAKKKVVKKKPVKRKISAKKKVVHRSKTSGTPKKKTSLSKTTKKKPVKKKATKTKMKKPTKKKKAIKKKSKRNNSQVIMLETVDVADPVDKVIVLKDDSEQKSKKRKGFLGRIFGVEVQVETSGKKEKSVKKEKRKADEIYHTFSDAVHQDKEEPQGEIDKQKKEIITHYDQIITDIAHEVEHNQKRK